MIGIDTVKIDRIKRFQERFGNKALEKFLHVEEIKLAKSTQTIAGFWAAKEAVSKALGLGISKECSFFDIKIHKDSKNAPFFTLSKHLIEKFEITNTTLSITHDGEYAIAVAYIESKTERINSLSH
jgi:holo-[acyl-carrier protein] synthase